MAILNGVYSFAGLEVADFINRAQTVLYIYIESIYRPCKKWSVVCIISLFSFVVGVAFFAQSFVGD